MRRSKYRRAPLLAGRNRRIAAATTTLVLFGALVTVSQVSNAADNRRWQPRASGGADCYSTDRGRVRHYVDDGADIKTATDCRFESTSTVLRRNTRDRNGTQDRTRDRDRNATQDRDRNGGDSDQQAPDNQQDQNRDNDQDRNQDQQAGQDNNAGGDNNAGEGDNNAGGDNNNEGENAGEGDNNGANNNGRTNPNDNGLGALADNCNNSNLEPHTGFQQGNRCVSTSFGEVGAANRNPSLLITEAPTDVDVNQGFTLRISTRNLVRDRFLAAGQGGYYLESSVLNGQGLVRGHFHTACRMLDNTDEAPNPDPVPAFFVATEDGGGGANPDEINIQVTGMPEQGTAQCAVWAGDGSHRIPMMERANQTPAIDAVRINVN